MIEFYTGNFGRRSGRLREAESGAAVGARQFLSRADPGLARHSREDHQQTQLREARRFYALAAQNPAAFKGDLRYVSPRILQLLQGS